MLWFVSIEVLKKKATFVGRLRTTARHAVIVPHLTIDLKQERLKFSPFQITKPVLSLNTVGLMNWIYICCKTARRCFCCSIISSVTDIYFVVFPSVLHLLLVIHYSVVTSHVVVLQTDDNKPKLLVMMWCYITVFSMFFPVILGLLYFYVRITSTWLTNLYSHFTIHYYILCLQVSLFPSYLCV